MRVKSNPELLYLLTTLKKFLPPFTNQMQNKTNYNLVTLHFPMLEAGYLTEFSLVPCAI